MLALMHRFALTLSIMTLVALGGVPTGQAQKTDSVQAKTKLAAIRSKIADLTQHIGDDLRARDAENARLRDIEMRITNQRQKLEELRSAQAAMQRRLTDLQNDQLHTQQTLDQQYRILAGHLRAAYMTGRQEPMKILLNQTNPASTGRALTYYGYLARERTSRIDAIRAQVARLQELAVAVLKQSDQLQMLSSQARQQIVELQATRTLRAEATLALQKQVSSGNQELARLKREESAVESLVADLARVLQDFPIDTQQPFNSLRGRLPWPVTGHLGASPAGVQRNGVLIETTRGARVRAPYFGRVVYADWLQGLGLLMIVGHGNGYLSLYGHTEVLYKSVGDWVAPGDVIAAFGDSAATPQLYFEIREGRKSVDAKTWLKNKP